MLYIALGFRVFIRFAGEIEPAMVENVNRDGTILVRFIRDDLEMDIVPEDIVYSEDTRA